MASPNLFVIGAMKAGTTTVYHYLRQHPAIFMSHVKEPQYFIQAPPGGWQGPDAANTAHRTAAEYASLFDAAGDRPLRGEASPVYLCDWHAPATLYRAAPDARLIAILRQPVDRAYSAWLMKRRHGYEQLEFADALAEEPMRIAQGWRYAWHYAALGRYAAQLEHYLQYFRADQINVVLYDDLVADPVAFMRGLYQFLSVDDTFVAERDVDQNPGFAVRHSGVLRWLTTPSRVRELVKPWLPSQARPLWRRLSEGMAAMNRQPSPRLDPEVRRTLTQQWDGEIRALESLVGRDLSRWRDG